MSQSAVSFPTNNPLVTVTRPSRNLWLLELHNGEDSRINVDFIREALQPALNLVEREWRASWRESKKAKAKEPADIEKARGALVIVGKRGQNKYFSNGLDYERLTSDPITNVTFTPQVLNPFLRRLITFPVPTVAAINGHIFAAAMVLALCCDYRVMTDGNSRNVWMSMNEIHFGAAYPLSFGAILRAKVKDPQTLRSICLEGNRYTPQDALKAGLVDEIVKGDTEAVIEHALVLGSKVGTSAISGAWGLIKQDLYRDVLETCARDVILGSVAAEDAIAKARL